MAYRISYECTGKAKRMNLWRIRLTYLRIFVAVVLLVLFAVWASGMNWSVTVGAMEVMTEEIGNGTDFTDAFSAFCIQVLQGAECG